MPEQTVQSVRYRYHALTKRLNKEFWGSESDTLHSLYVGSYGRGTAIHVSDIDILFILPPYYYNKYNAYVSNGQSALLQAIKNALLITYPNTKISGDGQVVQVSFSDDVQFEIVPCFALDNGIFKYPDTHYGGSWKITNPRAEITTINHLNQTTKNNLKQLCRMIRAWKDQNDVTMCGLLIDTMAYRFLKDWPYNKKGHLYYDWMIRDFFKFLSEQDDNHDFWCAVGSNQHITQNANFKKKAQLAYDNACQAIVNDKVQYWSKYYWKQIFGSKINPIF